MAVSAGGSRRNGAVSQAELGVSVAVTELDDRMPVPASATDLAQQATDDAGVVTACLNTSGCVGVSQWAVGDADSWVSSWPPFQGQGAATLFDTNYQPKPSDNAVLTALGGSSSGGSGGQEVVGQGSGKCLDVNGFGTADGNPVQLWDCYASSNQLWNHTGGQLINPISGKCLDASGQGTADGTHLQIWDCAGTQANQVWSLR